MYNHNHKKYNGYYRSTIFMPDDIYESLSPAGKKYADSLFFEKSNSWLFISKKSNGRDNGLEQVGILNQKERIEILRVTLTNFLIILEPEENSYQQIKIYIGSRVIWSGDLFFEMLMDVLKPFIKLESFTLEFGSSLRGALKIDDRINDTSINTLIIGEENMRGEHEKKIYVTLDLEEFRNIRKLSVPFINTESYRIVIRSKAIKFLFFIINENFGLVNERNKTLEHLCVETNLSLETIKEVIYPFESLISFTINGYEEWSSLIEGGF